VHSLDREVADSANATTEHFNQSHRLLQTQSVARRPRSLFFVSAGRHDSVPASACYWERQSGFSGSLNDVIANEFVSFDTGQWIVDPVEPSRVRDRLAMRRMVWHSAPWSSKHHRAGRLAGWRSDRARHVPGQRRTRMLFNVHAAAPCGHEHNAGEPARISPLTRRGETGSHRRQQHKC
jgi:hypothetical protein